MKKFGYTDERLDWGKAKYRQPIVFNEEENGRGLRVIEAVPGGARRIGGFLPKRRQGLLRIPARSNPEARQAAAQAGETLNANGIVPDSMEVYQNLANNPTFWYRCSRWGVSLPTMRISSQGKEAVA